MAVVSNDAGATVGDMVVIFQTSKALWTGAFLMYVLPVIGLITGAVMGNSLAAMVGINESLTALALGVLGLAFFFAITLFIARFSKFRSWLEPSIIEITQRSDTNGGIDISNFRSTTHQSCCSR